MSSLNKAMLIGRLGADPEVRYTKSNEPVANFSLATSEKYKDRNGEQQEKTEWHRIVAWGRLAEICHEYLNKGSLVYVEGPIQTNEWEDKGGVKKYTTEIKCLSMQMLEGKPQDTEKAPRPARSKPQPTVNIDNDFDDMDDDLPF